MTLFSDDARGAKMAAVAALILALGGWYAHIAMNVETGYRWAMEAPAERDGAPLVFPLWEVTRVDDADHYAISKIVKDVPVEGDATGLKVGDTISVIAAFRARDAMAVEERRELHPLRKYKEALGVAGFALALLAAPFTFRFRDGRIVERG